MRSIAGAIITHLVKLLLALRLLVAGDASSFERLRELERDVPAKRSIRRWHNRRVKDRAERIFRWEYLNPEEAADWARKNADHLKACSCVCCGNQRKYFGRTVQELRAFQSDEGESRAC